MKSKPLFHGTNELYWDDLANTIHVPSYWTDSPLESMDHSANSTRKYDSRMLILCIPKWDEKHFKLHPRQMPYIPETDAIWYEVVKRPWDDTETKNQMIEVYREHDLDDLVRNYFSKTQKEFLKTKSFQDKIKGF